VASCNGRVFFGLKKNYGRKKRGCKDARFINFYELRLTVSTFIAFELWVFSDHVLVFSTDHSSGK
jgi:hypothetical protein